MKTNGQKITFFFVVAVSFVIAWLLWGAFQNRVQDIDHQQEDLIETQSYSSSQNNNYMDDISVEHVTSNRHVVVPPDEVDEGEKGETLSPEEVEWEERRQLIRDQLSEIQKISRECESDLGELFEDPNFVDPRSDFYANPENAMRMVDILIAAVLSAYPTTEIYSELETAVDSGLPFDAREINHYMVELNGCLNPRIESFLMTLFDSFQIHNYSDEHRQSITSHILNYGLRSPVLSAPTLLSLNFQLNILNGMVRTGTLPLDIASDLESLQMQLVESHRNMSEVVYLEDERVSARDRRSEVYSDFRSREYVNQELQRLLDDLRRSLAVQ